jgi:hypothetical protein
VPFPLISPSTECSTVTTRGAAAGHVDDEILQDELAASRFPLPVMSISALSTYHRGERRWSR